MTPALQVRDLSVELAGPSPIRIVDGVSFDLDPGEILGLVGESGSGKSMTGLALLGLIETPLRLAGGSVRLVGDELVGASPDSLRQQRGTRIAMILQNPMSALNPTLRIGDQLIDAIRAHRPVPRRAAWEAARDALGRMGVPAPGDRMAAYPHELSGGMRQRVVIAMALINRPAVVIADEPTTALDVTVQAQILHEVRALCRSQGTGLIWITHDLAVVAGLADRLAVMYAGRIVEQGTVDDVLDNAAHPYTRGLIRSAPGRGAAGSRFFQIPGMPPSARDLVPGCRFAIRCSEAMVACSGRPDMTMIGPGHLAACHNVLERRI